MLGFSFHYCSSLLCTVRISPKFTFFLVVLLAASPLSLTVPTACSSRILYLGLLYSNDSLPLSRLRYSLAEVEVDRVRNQALYPTKNRYCNCCCPLVSPAPKLDDFGTQDPSVRLIPLALLDSVLLSSLGRHRTYLALLYSREGKMAHVPKLASR